MDDINYRHMADKEISSVIIPYGYTLVLFEKDGFIESSKLELEGAPWHDGLQSTKCVNLDGYLDLEEESWDDRVSSLAVYRTNRGAWAQGRW